jgi:hypothetical protein
MPEQEYRVRLTAETKQATDKLDAVQSRVNELTANSHDIRVNVDANAIKRAARETQEIANNIRSSKVDINEASNVSIVSGNSLNAAASLAASFYGIRRDVRGLEGDLGRALGKTNVSEFMRTEQFLDRVLENSKSRSREIVETYKNIREVPGASDLLGPVENFARAKAWETFGENIADQTIKGVQAGLKQSVVETKRFFYADLFDEIGSGVSRTVDTLARLGLAIQGAQLLIGPLAATWSAAFDSIIGQNIRLEQTILSTQTTLASTGRIFNQNTGVEIADPLQKIQALEGGVRQAIESIRARSLDLAGVTSQQIIDIFGVVATSISQVNGNIKDAEDLAISFTAALGTLGIPFYQARQEIGSILGGYITEDSLLAKRLQISNKDIEQAKNQIDGVVGYLKKKLEVAVAGQAIQAKGFAGVTSNIKEVFEVIAQKVGAPLLAPLVSGLTQIYNFLKSIQGIVSEVGQYITTVIANSLRDVAAIFAKSKVIQSIGAFIKSLAEPYDQLARAVELGLGGRGNGLLDEWLKGTERVPLVMQGVVDALRAFGSFLKLQIALVTEPIIKLLDMTRERLDGFKGVVQSAARSTQFVFFEGGDAFTKGWDTVASTIQYAATSLSKFALAIVKLKLTEMTAAIRAAAEVFELFGSVILGKLNLALSFFNFLGDVASSDLTKLLVAMIAINKVVNNTEFFGLKGLTQWLIGLRPLIGGLIGDAKLFVQGFKDAGNINNIISNTQGAYAKIFAVQGKSSNPVLQNAAAIEQMSQRLASLNALQAQMAAQGAGAEAMSKYSKAITNANESLAQLKKTEQTFTATQRAGAALKGLLGGGAEVAQAKEAARQASVLASGAATAQALSGAMEALATKLGMTKEQFKTLGGAAQAAGKSLVTFMTTTALINIGFTVAALGISALIARYQQLEEAERKVSITRKNMIAVNGILASGYASVIRAAEGGDIAAQRLLETQREIAQNQFNTDTSDLNDLKNKYSKLNDELYKYKATALEIAQEQAKYIQSGRWWDKSYIMNIMKADILTADIADKEKEITKNKEAQVIAEQRVYKAKQALAKISQEEKAVQDFKVLAERRKDLEERIARAREDYTKEITDKEFQSRLEYLNLEQQKRRELVEIEKAAMMQRYQLLIASSNEQESKILQIAQEYQAALLDAVASEEQRRAELMQKQMQLQKEIEDYAFKMAREKMNLEKQLGGYKKQMEQYLNQQQEIRIQKELTTLRSRSALQGTGYQPYNLEQQQSFINATQQSGREIDHRIAYAMLQVIPKSQLNMSGLEGGDVAVEKLRAALGDLPISMDTLVKLIRQFTSNSGDPSILADKLIKDAERAFNSSRFVTPQSTAAVTIPNLEIDTAGLQQRLQAAGDSVIQMFTALQETQAQRTNQQLSLLLQRAADPSAFTAIKADYTSELKRGSVTLQNFVLSLREWANGQSSATAEINSINQQFEAEIRALLQDYYKRNPAVLDTFKQYGVKEQDVTNAMISQKRTVPSDRGENVQFSFVPDIAKLISARRKARNAAIQRVNTNFDAANQVNASNQFTTALQTQISPEKVSEQRTQMLGAAAQSFEELRASTKGATYSLTQTIQSIDSEMAKLKLTIISNLKVPPTTDQLSKLNEAVGILRGKLVETATALAPANTALETYRAAIERANRATDSLFGAYSQLVTELLIGNSNIRDAIQSFSEQVGKEFLSMITEYMMTPMKEQIRTLFQSVFGVPSLEEKAKAELLNAGVGLTTAGTNLQSAASAQQTAAAELTKAANALSSSGAAGSSTPMAIPVVSADTLKEKDSDQPKKQSKFVNELNRGLSAVTQSALGVTMAFDGLKRVTEGSGTYDTLMGISSVLMGVGSIFSGIGSLGKKAYGGSIHARTPYIVGENGPEIITPESYSSVIPNGRAQALIASRNALSGPSQNAAGGDAFAANRDALGTSATLTRERYVERVLSSGASASEIRYSRVGSGDLPFVTEADMIQATRAAAERGAQLGQQRTLTLLRSNPAARRNLGF